MVWFRDYKIPDGKPPNAFGYDSKPMNSEFAEMVIAGTHNLCALPRDSRACTAPGWRMWHTTCSAGSRAAPCSTQGFRHPTATYQSTLAHLGCPEEEACLRAEGRMLRCRYQGLKDGSRMNDKNLALA